jgi:hypothetical protein
MHPKPLQLKTPPERLRSRADPNPRPQTVIGGDIRLVHIDGICMLADKLKGPADVQSIAQGDEMSDVTTIRRDIDIQLDPHR